MHKKIVLILARIIDESPYDFCNYTIIDNPKSDGFWGLTVKMYDVNNAHSSAFIAILRDIGLIYGEGLSIEEDGDLIKIK